MARQTINIGTTANDGTGDPLRTAFDKINDNFSELYGGDDNASTILEHDTAPKLAANLDVNNFQITTDVTNGNVSIQPNGTGNVTIGALQVQGTSVSSSDSTAINVNDGLVVDGTASVSGALSSATSLALATGATVTGIADEDDMTSNSATLLATQQSIKAYVDTQITAEDLDFSADDSTVLSIDLDSEVLHFAGGNGISTSVSNNTVTHAIDTGTVVTKTDTQTLTNKTLTSPKIGTSILDTNGNELFLLTATGSAVNEITYANAASGNNPTFTASGETNVGVSILPKGSGQVTIDNLTFPAADGSANQILTTNGSGDLSWGSGSGGDFVGDLASTSQSYPPSCISRFNILSRIYAL